METETATVLKVLNSGVKLGMDETQGCKSCAISVVCSKNKKRFFVKTDKKYKEGDKVEVKVEPSARMFSSFVVFAIPIIIMLCVYFFSRIFLSEDFSVLLTIVSLLPSIVIIRTIDFYFKDKIDVSIIPLK